VSVRADCFVTVGQWTSGVGFRAWAWGLGVQVVPAGATFVDCGGFVYISVAAVTAAGGFALTASPFFKRQKGTKRLCPDVRPLAGARCSFVPAFIWGHRLRSASRRPPLDVCGSAARRCAPTPQTNASTQPADGAGRSKARSRSRAAGELPLGLLSGEERAVDTGPLWELACRRWRSASRPISCRCTPNPVGAGLPAMAACQPTSLFQVYPVHCGSWPASDGGLPADQSPADVHRTLWERACPRWRPDSRPVSFRCTRSTVGAGLPADQSLPAAH
jgi:hypothetical protein